MVCDPERRQQLIEQRQRLLEAESQGKTIEVNGHKAKAVAAVALPAPEAQSSANVEAGNGTVAQDQSPAPKQDPLSQWRESIRTAATWKTNDPPENHAGMFGPHPEEPY